MTEHSTTERMDRAPSLRDICNALGTIQHKWFKIGVSLGIPHHVLQGFKTSQDPLSDVVDYCLRGNAEEGSSISWKSIVASLKSSHVDEHGLAEKICHDHCKSIHDKKATPQSTDSVESETNGIRATANGSHRPSPATFQERKIHPDVKMDLKFILDKNLKQIVIKYASYVDCLREAISEKGVCPEDFKVYLLSLPALNSNSNKLSLLSDKKKELDECKTIATIFAFLTTECASFLNYEIFESIRSKYKVKDEEGILISYSDSLKSFVDKHKLSNFEEINTLLKHRKGTKSLTLKYDIETTCSLAKVHELKNTVAEILDVSPSTLEIIDIEEGCVIVTFLIPAFVADALFTPATEFTPQQKEKLRANFVLWMRCNGQTYNFEVQQISPTLLKLKEQLSCSICLGTYTDPRQLQCQHSFCQECLVGLGRQDQHGQLTLTCPTCRKVTPVPASGVTGLQADFRTNQLLEFMDEELKDSVTSDKVRSKRVSETSSMPMKKAAVSCPEHDGEYLKLYCETCGEAICHKCVVESGKHNKHNYSDLDESIDQCKAKISLALGTTEKTLA